MKTSQTFLLGTLECVNKFEDHEKIIFTKNNLKRQINVLLPK